MPIPSKLVLAEVAVPIHGKLGRKEVVRYSNRWALLLILPLELPAEVVGLSRGSGRACHATATGTVFGVLRIRGVMCGDSKFLLCAVEETTLVVELDSGSA